MAKQTEGLEKYTSAWVETFLTNYEVLIGDAAELAAEWPEMDEEEQMVQRSLVMSDWGERYTLGDLYRAGRLTPDQVTRLAKLDQALLEAAPQVEICYGPTLPQLVKNLLAWGTPLTEEKGTIRLEIPFHLLPVLAQTPGG